MVCAAAAAQRGRNRKVKGLRTNYEIFISSSVLVTEVTETELHIYCCHQNCTKQRCRELKIMVTQKRLQWKAISHSIKIYTISCVIKAKYIMFKCNHKR